MSWSRSPLRRRRTAGAEHGWSPWIVSRYFGRYNPDRQDRWVFGDRNSGAYLPKFAWTKIVRHKPGPRGRVSGRPRPGRLLGRTAQQEQAPARPQNPAPATQAATGPARSAESCCCTPTASHKAHASGNSGTAPPAKRSPGNTWSSTGTACRTRPDSFTAPASAEPPTDNRNQHLCTPEIAPVACLSRVPRRVARTVLRGPGAAMRRGYPTAPCRSQTFSGFACPGCPSSDIVVRSWSGQSVAPSRNRSSTAGVSSFTVKPGLSSHPR